MLQNLIESVTDINNISATQLFVIELRGDQVSVARSFPFPDAGLERLQVGFQRSVVVPGGPRQLAGPRRLRRQLGRRRGVAPAVQHLPGHLQPAAQLQRVPAEGDDGGLEAQPGRRRQPAGRLRAAGRSPRPSDGRLQRRQERAPQVQHQRLFRRGLHRHLRRTAALPRAPPPHARAHPASSLQVHHGSHR